MPSEMDGAGISIRPEQAGEEQIARAIVAEAFGDSVTPVLLERLRESTAWRDLSFFALAEEEPVAHLCYTRCWVDSPGQLIEVLILSPMSVKPEWQRKGVGTKLIKQSLQILAAVRTEPVVFLEGNPAVYSKSGFLNATDYGFSPPSVRIPEPAFQCVLLPTYEPTIRGALVYPDVFWLMDAVGLR